MVTEQLAQVLLPIKTVGYKNVSLVIAHPFRSQRVSWNDLTIQPTITHSNEATLYGHSDWYYSPLGSLKIGTDVQS